MRLSRRELALASTALLASRAPSGGGRTVRRVARMFPAGVLDRS